VIPSGSASRRKMLSAAVACRGASWHTRPHAIMQLGEPVDSAFEQARLATEASLAAFEEAEEAADATQATRAFDVRSLAGISAPLGFWDPANFCEGSTEGTVRFWREVEIKHGRVAMLGAVGFPLAEQWHPLWGGEIDVPSFIAFQQTPLQSFWPAVILAIAAYEVFSVFTFARPYDLFYTEAGGLWQIRADHPPGDMRFDPLGLMPTDPEARKEMETKELNHGRLAMIGMAGMVVQEGLSGAKLF
jgi:light-harvesting complex I chlorophyll a/b binding protein 4